MNENHLYRFSKKGEMLAEGGDIEWAAIIRNALVWCGMSDPCESKRDVEDSDPVREELTAVLSAWQQSFGRGGGGMPERPNGKRLRP